MPRNQGTSRKGKPKKHERAAGMGRALQKAKGKRHTPSASTGGMAMRQGVDSINIEQEDNRASVLDMNDLDDFLIQAEMANREFASEKEQYVILDPNAQEMAGEDEAAKTIRWSDQPSAPVSSFAFQELSVPRRPAWDETTTREELDKREKESFLEWRRAIAKKEEEIVLKSRRSLGVTPFEKNLEIWRQLWRVMERCSCIVQIVDARNPLFYLSKDLKQYATEELKKPMLLLINKSDYLTAVQRKAWHDYFSDPEQPWKHVFFSAHEEQQKLDSEAVERTRMEEEEEEEEEEETSLLVEDDHDAENGTDQDHHEDPEESRKEATITMAENVGVENPLSREELLDWLLAYAARNDCQTDPRYERVPFGMVGFPNVGKSSVINVLMGNTKHAHGVVRVAVAAQPGKTKHFQTLLLPDRENMLLCDCPGLVFPSFVNNTADLIAAGVFPIAQMRDPWPVVKLLCKRIPREILNAHYGIQIPMPTADAMLQAEEGTVPPPTAEEFLTTYCIARSLLAAASGVPDFQRASRMVIKEYAAGKLLYCHAPPDFDNTIFQEETLTTAVNNTKKLREKLKDSSVAKSSTELENNKQDGQQSDREDDVDSYDGEDDDGDGGSINKEPTIEDDDMLIELMGGLTSAGASQPGNANSSKARPGKKKKWGKKGRKLRNKDPYGCHSTPDDALGADGTPLGVSVKSGKKHARKGYVRPNGYGGARSAAF